MDSLDNIIKNHLKGDQLKQFNKIYYGREDHCELKLKESTINAINKNNFDVTAYSFSAATEQVRKPNVLRLGLIQHSIVLPTDKPINEQRQAVFDKIEKIIEVAASEDVRILCLQEAWSMPFCLCTKEKEKWENFTENAINGPSTTFLSKLAKKYEMVIISPILEKDEHGVWWNTAVVIDENGNYMGKHRKNHLPSVGSFSESSYYSPGNLGHPVFNTKYAKIAVNICYGRHHALNWLMFALNGAQIVFNPAATVGEFGESFWGIEARNAAIANSYFTCSINRVGTEKFVVNGLEDKIRRYYGSTYVTAPNGCRTPGLSKNKDGLLITEVDLNLNWLMFTLNGAQIVFNPAATVGEFGESFWGIEARNAAIANSYFTCSINRVGTGYYGSTYVTAPNGCRTPGLSKNKDGLLITEVDLNLCRQMKDSWGFNMTSRLDIYAEAISKYNN